MTSQSPSSGPSDHLLPPGEKGNSTLIPATGFPSPLAGEGARRAGEGGCLSKAAKLKAFARNMRHEPTEAEHALWLLLRNRRFVDFKFRCQVPIGPYIADFVCYSAKLIIEADGSQHAESSRDFARDAELVRRGFHLLRLWNDDILARPDAVLDAIWHALQAPSSALWAPSPTGGEGDPVGGPDSAKNAGLSFSPRGRRWRAATDEGDSSNSKGGPS